MEVALAMYETVLGEHYTEHIAGHRDVSARLVNLKCGERTWTAGACMNAELPHTCTTSVRTTPR